MRLTSRPGDQASEVKRSTLAAWYLGACFVVCLIGAAWLASLFGVIDFGGGGGSEASRVVTRAASQKAAAQQLQARLAAEEEARHIAEDAARWTKPSAAAPTPTPDPAASSPGLAQPAASPTSQPAPE